MGEVRIGVDLPVVYSTEYGAKPVSEAFAAV
jgi:hypothetical protein